MEESQTERDRTFSFEIFTVSCSGSKSCGRPAIYTKKYAAREELGIILSPKASLEMESSKLFQVQSLYRGGELGIASLERERPL